MYLNYLIIPLRNITKKKTSSSLTTLPFKSRPYHYHLSKFHIYALVYCIGLYAKQKERHRCTEQTFGLCGRRRGCDVLREQHWNMYIIKGDNRSPAQVGCMRQVLGAGALGRPRGIGWGRRWEGGLRWGTHVNPWLIHVNVWQKPLQYCKVISLQLIKINGKK